MKILATREISCFPYLRRAGILIEVLPYEDVLYGETSADQYDAIVIDITDEEAEGLLTPRSFISNGHSVPLIGVINDEEAENSSKSFEQMQAKFLDQGGMYLLKSTTSPELFKACVSQSAVFGTKKAAQRLPVRLCVVDGHKLKIDLRSHRVFVDGELVHLTLHEYFVLELLAIRVDGIVTKEAILGHLYSGIDVPEIKIVDVFVCKLRKKLGPTGVLVETQWGRGYSLVKNAVSEVKAA